MQDYWWLTGRRLVLSAAAIQAEMVEARPLRFRLPPKPGDAERLVAGIFDWDPDLLPPPSTEDPGAGEEGTNGKEGVSRQDLATRRRSIQDIFDDAVGFRGQIDVGNIDMISPPAKLVSELKQIHKVVVANARKRRRGKIGYSIGYEAVGRGVDDGRVTLNILCENSVLGPEFVRRIGQRLRDSMPGTPTFVHRGRFPRAAQGDRRYVGEKASLRMPVRFSIGFKVEDRDLRRKGHPVPCAIIPGHVLYRRNNDGIGEAVYAPPYEEAKPVPLGIVKRCAWSNSKTNATSLTDAALVELHDDVSFENELGPEYRNLKSRPGPEQEIVNGDEVTLYGATTEIRRTRVHQIDVNFSEVLLPDGDIFGVSDAILAGDGDRRVVRPGDSGGGVVDSENRAVGTIVGWSLIREGTKPLHLALIVPIEATLEALGANL